LIFAQSLVLIDNSKHDVNSFDCGQAEMNQFLARYAAKHMNLGLSRTWVLTVKIDEKNKKIPLAAYYTLASTIVEREQLPIKKSLPRYPVPVVLLARLAVDKGFQSRGIGEKVLITALRKSVELTERGLPALGVVVDVLDNAALKFYHKFDIFESFIDNPMRLFVPMNVVKHI